MNQPITYELSAPVSVMATNGDVLSTISTINLRLPRGKDIARLGIPFTIKDDVVFNPAIVREYIAHLGNVPTSTVDQLSAFDFMALMTVVCGFFDRPAVGNTSTPPNSSAPTTMSPGSTGTIEASLV